VQVYRASAGAAIVLRSFLRPSTVNRYDNFALAVRPGFRVGRLTGTLWLSALGRRFTARRISRSRVLRWSLSPRRLPVPVVHPIGVSSVKAP